MTEFWIILSQRSHQWKLRCVSVYERFQSILGAYLDAVWSKSIRKSVIYLSMTKLLTHSVADSTKPSYRPKTNNQPLKKFSSLVISWVKVAKNCKMLIFKVNFSCQTLSKTFFSLKNMNTFCYKHFSKTSSFTPLHFIECCPIFDDLYSTEHKTWKLFKGLVAGFGPKEMPGRMCNIVRLK